MPCVGQLPDNSHCFLQFFCQGLQYIILINTDLYVKNNATKLFPISFGKYFTTIKVQQVFRNIVKPRSYTNIDLTES